MLGKNKGSLDTVERIPRGSVGVEIGVWRGDTSARFLERCGFLHMVDPWAVEPYQDDPDYLKKYSKLTGSLDPADFQKYYDNIYRDVCGRFKDRPVKIHRCTSDHFFDTFTDKVDWVYIDGLHTFDGCLSDLQNSLKIVKEGGWIFGDDYGNKPEVKRAVDTFGMGFELFGLNQYGIPV